MRYRCVFDHLRIARNRLYQTYLEKIITVKLIYFELRPWCEKLWKKNTFVWQPKNLPQKLAFCWKKAAIFTIYIGIKYRHKISIGIKNLAMWTLRKKKVGIFAVNESNAPPKCVKVVVEGSLGEAVCSVSFLKFDPLKCKIEQREKTVGWLVISWK